MTDVTGPYYTLALEREFPSRAAEEARRLNRRDAGAPVGL
jgi:hypothetical protein